MQELSPDDIRRVAKLAKLRLDDDAIEDARTRLSAVLHHMDALQALDLEDLEPMTAACEEPARLRSDEPGSTLDAETLKAMAPAVYESQDPSGDTDDEGQPIMQTFIAVPKVIGEGGGA